MTDKQAHKTKCMARVVLVNIVQCWTKCMQFDQIQSNKETSYLVALVDSYLTGGSIWYVTGNGTREYVIPADVPRFCAHTTIVEHHATFK